MKAVRRSIAVLGSTAVAVAGVCVLTAAPAAAGSYKCTKAQSITAAWGKVTYTRCSAGLDKNVFSFVEGKVQDLNAGDKCIVRATFTFSGTKVEFKVNGSTDKFKTTPKLANTFSAKLHRLC
ncbi:hypothetical protein DY218_13995 [Streptomyces triticagri]|uniref:Streptomyces killer toxin-like beta/gamma crystallin domain-containing protein n=1 Tax=Streptomyces triticagri TaxID=2293568 RepID=A0A372M505_9ACTN|nr:hypothetical protein [Streptomyces triticagri]RFU86016.1 hypothetical protein DY218_13995 [Streptomyces triticagri]